MNAPSSHIPVLLAETLLWLDPKHGDVVVDATLGRGGHSRAILERMGDSGTLLSLDRDPEALVATEELAATHKNWVRQHKNFSELIEALREANCGNASGFLADLGVSSPQIDNHDRGFSFQVDGPLDMRMDPTAGESAADVIATLSVDELADVIFEFGEERRSRAIARSIKRGLDEGEMQTTNDLRRAVLRAAGSNGRQAAFDCLARVFQALRIYVNDELGELDQWIRDIPQVAKPGARVVIISFHSLEDRVVKHAFRAAPFRALTKRPIIAGEDELAQNPRARSAKLRCAEIVAITEEPPYAR